VKALRRKLGELLKQDEAGLFQELLAKRWVKQPVVATDYLTMWMGTQRRNRATVS
jgi:hypothetical protein